MSTSDVSADGVMVVHGSNGDESYEITKIPPPTAYFVQNAKKNILQHLGLQSVLTDLNRASDLLYLAYLGVIGTGDLHARISTRQKALCDLCGQCVVTMTALSDGSRIVLDRLTEAYSYLLEANEKRALRILRRCGATAATMATNCGELAREFGKLKDDTTQDAATATKAYGDEAAKIREFEGRIKDMEAAFKVQETVSSMLKEIIEKMNNEIAEEKTKEETAEIREFVVQILGAFTGAIGLGGHARPNREELTIRKEDKANAQKVNDEAKMAETKARGRQRKAEKKVFDAKTDKEAKQVRLDAAKATNTADAGHEEKVREAQTAFDASSITQSKLLVEQEHAEEDLELAKTRAIDAKAALDAAVAALDNIVSTANKMSQQQADRATKYTNNRIELVKRECDLEEKRRESIGQLASLTSRLETNKREINVDKLAQTALEIVIWALNNIFASLSNAKVFWDSMATFCDQLAVPKTIEQIDDEIADERTREERIKFYKSPKFVEPGIDFISKWTALAIVCDEYAVASQHARKSVLGHIKASPNAEEARKLIEPLKKQLQDELGNAAAESDSKINTLKTETKQLEAENAAIKADDEGFLTDQVLEA